MIPFNKPLVIGNEIKNIKEVLSQKKLSGDGLFTKKCNLWLENNLSCPRAFLTTSGTSALEMAAILINIQPGDEVIMPSFTFVSTANAFVLRGAKIVFVDIRPDTMNLDENLIEQVITTHTKAIVPVHYAGIPCEMDKILSLAKKYNLFVIEDAAQGIMSKYKGQALGTIGEIGCYSFHETKNYTCGEGGAISINHPKFTERAEIIREKGTDRSKFFRGEVNKYTWVDIGSSYLPSELNAAYLFAQFENAQKIIKKRLKKWDLYYEKLSPLSQKGLIELPTVPEHCNHNAHMFYLKTKNLRQRSALIKHLKDREIMSVFHYIPLHSAPAGLNHVFAGKDKFTTKESERLLRLPLYYELSTQEIDHITQAIQDFYS